VPRGRRVTIARLLRPNVLIPTILALAVIAALLSISNVGQLGALWAGIKPLDIAWFACLMVAYETMRGVQWHVLLRAVDVHAPPRATIFAYATTEVTKNIPIGNYFQNYVLAQSRGADFGRTSAATTLIIVTEVVLSLLGVVVLGVGAWTPWLRPLILIGGSIFLALVGLVYRYRRAIRVPGWLARSKPYRAVRGELEQFGHGAAALVQPRVIAVEAALAACYLVLAGAALYVVVVALGVGRISLGQAVAVYLASLAFALTFPIPFDLGAIEVSAVGAFLALGLDNSTSVGIVLINRALSIGVAMAVALIVTLILPGELRAALRGQGRAATPEQPSDTADVPAGAPRR
jgi:uncharacterized membrane protein YbhN (UPF0104 family)